VREQVHIDHGAVLEAPSGASAAAIRHHYDVGNDFFALWLDDTWSYSCGLWDGAEDLTTAQHQKIDFFCSRLVRPGAALLDVGCGFGGLLRRAVDVHGVASAVGLTLSDRQAERAGAHHDLDVHVRSWEAHDADGAYDAVVSVGAFEHFARPELDGPGRVAVYRRFFERAHGWTRPGGRIGVQSIVNENMQPHPDDDLAITRFFYEEVFPESSLPRLAEIVSAADPWFRLSAIRNDGDHYARTCREWQRRLRARRAEAEALVGPDVVDWWLKYLGVASYTFRAGWCGLARLVWERRPDPVHRLLP
jgi:cyclopropane-fatty-acyl-phospholipid synthase